MESIHVLDSDILIYIILIADAERNEICPFVVSL
jgi:hypothetical protein